MGYYCTVPQCTSLAGKTKNVKFHRFPRDTVMADKWNIILKRGKPYTKYSKVCSLHFTQADYNVTTMGQWKTLNKDAVPSQNLPRLHPDGTVMVIRKSRTVKCRESRPDCHSEKPDKWTVQSAVHTPADPLAINEHDNIAYRLQALSAIASNLSPQPETPHAPHMGPSGPKPKKQDAIMQTDPVQSEEDESQPDNSYNEPADPYAYRDPYKDDKPYTPYKSQERVYEVPVTYKETDPYKNQEVPYKSQDGQYKSQDGQYKSQDGQYKSQDGQYKSQDGQYKSQDGQYKSQDGQYKSQDAPYKSEENPYKPQENPSPAGSYKGLERKEYNDMAQKYNDSPKNYTKQEDYIPQTNEEYNKEAEKYALERKNPSAGYEKPVSYDKPVSGYEKAVLDSYQKVPVPVENYQKMPDMYADYQARSEYLYTHVYDEARRHEPFTVKQELDLDEMEANSMYGERARAMLPLPHQQVKREPDLNAGRHSMFGERARATLPLPHQQVKREPDLNGCEGMPGYYHNGHSNLPVGASRPGAELLIAKQNALAAHTQLWQNTMKRPFFYSENYAAAPLLRYHEDYTKILQ